MSRLSYLCAVAMAAMLLSGPGAAGEWKDKARVRLIDGGTMADGVTRLAGLEILLDPEWKTYWRNPGDSGIPPKMDFSGSDNVAEVTAEWPAPELSFDGYGWVIGYTEAVIFPLLVRPDEPGESSNLNLKLDYAVCNDICIPAQAEVAVVLDGAKPHTAEIEFYRRRVPAPIDTPMQTGGVVSGAVVRKDDKPVLQLLVRFPSDGEEGFALVEGPEEWYLPVPERTGTDAAGNAIFEVSLEGIADQSGIPGTTIRVTGVSPDFSFEQPLTLD